MLLCHLHSTLALYPLSQLSPLYALPRPTACRLQQEGPCPAWHASCSMSPSLPLCLLYLPRLRDRHPCSSPICDLFHSLIHETDPRPSPPNSVIPDRPMYLTRPVLGRSPGAICTCVPLQKTPAFVHLPDLNPLHVKSK